MVSRRKYEARRDFEGVVLGVDYEATRKFADMQGVEAGQGTVWVMLVCGAIHFRERHFRHKTGYLRSGVLTPAPDSPFCKLCGLEGVEETRAHTFWRFSYFVGMRGKEMKRTRESYDQLLGADPGGPLRADADGRAGGAWT